MTELGEHLGPLLWQFAPTKKFDAADFGGFLELLPEKFDGRALRHVIEVRHDSFCTPEFIALLRQFAMPVVFTDHAKYPNIADLTGDFVYARLQRGKDTITTAYPPKEIDAWADRLRAWAQGKEPADLPRVGAGSESQGRAARRVRLRHPRRQSARTRRRHGVDRTALIERLERDEARGGFQTRPSSPQIFQRAGAGISLRGRSELAVEFRHRRPVGGEVQFGAGGGER